MCRPFSTGLQRQLARLEAYLGPWREGFGSWYPNDEDGSGPTSLRMQVAQQDPGAYQTCYYDMTLGDLLLYLEARRVGQAFQDMQDSSSSESGTPSTLDGPSLH